MVFPTQRAKLALAAWLEMHTKFRLPTHAKDLTSALEALDTSPHPISYSMQLSLLKRYFNRVILGILTVSFLLGLIAVPSAFATSQSNQVNIFWLFIVLLGFNLLNLTTWFITMIGTMKHRSENKGILLSSLIFLNKKISKHSQLDEATSEAYLHWQCPALSNKWLVSSISHGAWGCYLFAGWLMTLLLLLTNQVNFVWETTLLSDETFIQLTQTLSMIPHWFGLSLPDQLDILASRIDLTSQSSSTRQHWANFLLASIMVYGVLPRLILTLISMSMYYLKRSTQSFSTQERLIKNRYQHKEDHSKTIIDHDSNKAATVKNTSNQEPIETLDDSAFSQPWALFEWSAPQPSYLCTASALCLLNSREEQARFLSEANSTPVYILVDATQSPDRGSRRFFTQVSASYSSPCMAISDDDKANFIEDWQRLAKETQLPFTRIIKKD
ncbi:hypothetical protein MUS1_06595 [Marinomonas ushuaiensis DSM 15871]|uniref:DUF2868 domain-containing protein n=1 Tax=Marinomonas ushuaiensis DSM 15871 TaxID=1122207 RepID=X7E334_9GAMM|nr:DUF2868 domain-containing protein [Marinomonas ushuaiensis]ETX09588.1 hypothetical protein MUS1_06595 [Marinomonas ushuaiensis DSM 15871]